ncbi:MAG: hypothetical protein KDA41_06110, partial [Planctomycetales bacterium]|nr:hypothetical protein [Planctomycetales bacterium]
MPRLLAKLPEERQQQAQWAVAPQWGVKHEWHMASNFILPFYANMLRLRLPEAAGPADRPTPLSACRYDHGWLGDGATWKTPAPSIAPVAEFQGAAATACWLPDAYTAALWQAFVSHGGPVRIESPKPMKGSNPFVAYPAGKPLEVAVRVADGFGAAKIELFDGDRRLAEVDRTSHTATLEGLKPGIYGIIAAATGDDGRATYSPPHAVAVV